MIKFAILLILMLFSTGCSVSHKENSIASKQNIAKRNHEVQTLTLQYRMSRDAVAPSKFVAIYNNGMTLGLKIHWKISETEKKNLDKIIKQIEDNPDLNGKEFSVKGRWLHEGYELEVFEIKEKF